jgi:hypothetical protein
VGSGSILQQKPIRVSVTDNVLEFVHQHITDIDLCLQPGHLKGGAILGIVENYCQEIVLGVILFNNFNIKREYDLKG